MSDTPFFNPEQTFGCMALDQALKLSGMDVMEGMLAGEIPFPPIYELMNIKMTAASDGVTNFEALPAAKHFNPIGTIHGGWVGTLMDAALASCIHSKIPAGKGMGTIEYKVSIVRSLTDKSGPVFCEGRVLHFGRTIATSEARLTDAKGRLIAHGTETCSIFDINP